MLSTVFLYAHPHTFIDVYPNIKISKDGYIKKVNIKWVMDEMTSSMLIMEFDDNGDSKINKSENDYIKKNYFLSLKDYDFYMHLKQKYKIKDFFAQIEDNKIIYNFSIFLNKKIKVKNFTISFYDTDFFVAMRLKKEFVKQNIPYKVDDIDGDFYYGYKITYK